VYGDLACGQVWVSDAVDALPGAADYDATCWAAIDSGLYGFAEDSRGELYLIQGLAGRIDCIHDGDPDGCYWAGWGIFADGFESGSTARWSASTP
jgi:hypothetical protein